MMSYYEEELHYLIEKNKTKIPYIPKTMYQFSEVFMAKFHIRSNPASIPDKGIETLIKCYGTDVKITEHRASLRVVIDGKITRFYNVLQLGEFIFENTFRPDKALDIIDNPWLLRKNENNNEL